MGELKNEALAIPSVKPHKANREGEAETDNSGHNSDDYLLVFHPFREGLSNPHSPLADYSGYDSDEHILEINLWVHKKAGNA